VSSAVGNPVWNWSANLQEFGENDPRASSLYVSEIAQSYLLVSNNLEQLQQIAARLRGSPQEAARALNDVREWGEVSRHEFWGYRRYRHDRVSNKFAAGMTRVTPAMDALALYADPGEQTGVLRLFTTASDETTTENVAKMIDVFKPQGPGVWQAFVPLENRGNDPRMKNLAQLTWLFGFGLAL